MIDIQKVIKKCFAESTSLTLDQIYVSSVSPNTPKPYACIVPLKGVLTPAWHWEHQQKQGQKSQRKYNVSQPLSVEFAYIDKKLLSDDLNEFLIHLPKEHLNMQIQPSEINYIFSEGMLGSQQAQLLININYGICREVTSPIIKDIHITVQDTSIL